MPSSPPFVSVIIPVFDNPEELRRCLAALEAQTFPSERYEVIVADNGSAEDVGPLVGAFAHARAIRELRPGSYAARNAAVAVARGDVFGFTDSDCVPDTAWIARGVEALARHPEAGLIAGEIEVFVRSGVEPTTAELLDLHELGFPQRRFVEESHFGATANVWTTRAVWERNGPFDATLKSSGDVDWGQRLHALGLPPVFAPEVIVRHPARPSYAEMRKRFVRIKAGYVDRTRQTGGSLLRLTLQHVRPPALACARIARNPGIKGPRRKLACMAMMNAIRLLELAAVARLAFAAAWRRR